MFELELMDRIAADQLRRGLRDAAAEAELRAALQRQGCTELQQDMAVLDLAFARKRLAHRRRCEHMQARHDTALQQAIQE